MTEIYSTESARKAHSEAIKRGKTIYGLLAKEGGTDPVTALATIPSVLSLTWVEPEEFWADLGNDNILAIIEARRHFHLPP